MLVTLMPELKKDLQLDGDSLIEGPGAIYQLALNADYIVTLTDFPNGCTFRCLVAPAPQQNREEVFLTNVMHANLLGRSTNGAVLGLTEDGGTVTCTQVIDYPIRYKEFKLLLEDFFNLVDYWRNEALTGISKSK